MSSEVKSEPLTHDDYQVGWICALPLEAVAATALLDEEHLSLDQDPGDMNTYTLGRIGRHNVAIGCLPLGTMGESPATAVAKDMLRSFPNIKIGFMVGVGGGAPGPPSENPENDIRLGDIVVSKPGPCHGGVIQYDYGKTISEGEFMETGYLNRPPNVLLTALTKLLSRNELEGSSVSRYVADMRKKYPRKSQDWLYQGAENDHLYVETFRHADIQRSCRDIGCAESEDRVKSRKPRSSTDPVIHCGLIASGNQVMRDSVTREKLREKHGVLCFEMEAAGLNNNFPCLVIRGICDYSDSHKNKSWQPYAAAVSAAFTKELLEIIPVAQIEREHRLSFIIGKMDKEFRRLNDHMKPLLQEQEREERRKILNWLASNYYQSQHADALRDLDHSSGRNFMDHELFKAWSEGNDDMEVIFCPGLPGAGKTSTASIVIDELQKSQGEKRLAIAFLYLNYNLRSDQTLICILRSLLRQLVEDLPAIPDEITELHYANREPSLHEVIQALSIVVGKHHSTFIVADALDECSPEILTELLDAIQRLQSIGARFMLTSRFTNVIDRELKSFQKCSTLEIRAVDKDIEAYITRLFDFSTFYKVPEEAAEIERFKRVVIGSAQGMFILVRLFINILKNRCTRGEIEEELENIENGRTRNSLHEAYQKTSHMIDKTGHSEWAYRVISWVFHARRPLSADELTEAIAAQTQRDATHLDLNYAPADIDRVISYCAGLIVLSPNTGKIEFVHFTAYQYFQEYRHQYSWIDKSLKEIALTCFKYLSFNPFDSASKHTSFLKYAVHFWAEHSRPVQSDQEVRKAAEGFLQNPSLTDAADKMFPADEYVYISFSTLIDNDQVAGSMGLHLVARFGLTTLLEELLGGSMVTAVNTRDSYGQTPLILAVRQGHCDIVNILLRKPNVDPNLTDDDGRSPLSIASQLGHLNIVQLLLSAGKVDPNIPASDGWSPMMYATRGGHQDIVHLLLRDDKTDPNLVSPDGQAALTLAADTGSADIVKLLLESGKVNTDPSYTINQDTFMIALENGNQEVLQILLQNGYAHAVGPLVMGSYLDFADPSSLVYKHNPRNGRILWLAVEHGLTDAVVSLLRDGKVDPNLIDASGKSVLMHAVESGRKNVVEALLNGGCTSVNAQDSQRRTALGLAVHKRDVAMTRTFLLAGANPSLGAVPFQTHALQKTPLPYAIEQDYQDIVDVFIEFGNIDPNLSLRTAISCERTAIIRKLLSIPGADFSTQEKRTGKTALMVAVETQDIGLIHTLLKNRATDVNLQDRWGTTALTILARKGHNPEILKILVEDYGADTGIPNHVGRIALDLAVETGWTDDEVVRLLSPTRARGDFEFDFLHEAEFEDLYGASVEYFSDISK